MNAANNIITNCTLSSNFWFEFFKEISMRDLPTICHSDQFQIDFTPVFCFEIQIRCNCDKCNTIKHFVNELQCECFFFCCNKRIKISSHKKHNSPTGIDLIQQNTSPYIHFSNRIYIYIYILFQLIRLITCKWHDSLPICLLAVRSMSNRFKFICLISNFLSKS